MPLNSSGPISIGGSTVGQSINLELGRSATAQSSLNESVLRTLAGVASGQISLSNFYGKSNVIATQTFTTPGYHYYTIPGGTRADIIVAGGGGGGAAGYVYEVVVYCNGELTYLETTPTAGAGGGSGGITKATFAVESGLVLTVFVGQAGAAGNSSGASQAARSGQNAQASTVSLIEDVYIEPPGEPPGVYSLNTIYIQGGGGGGGYWPTFYEEYGECIESGTNPSTGGAGASNNVASSNSFQDRLYPSSTLISAGVAGTSTVSIGSTVGGSGASRTSFQEFSGSGGAGGNSAAGSAGTGVGAGGGGGGVTTAPSFFNGGAGAPGRVRIVVY